MYYVLVGLYVLVCFLLLVVVLLQQGKGGDIAAAFGGSSSQTAFGARAGATVLTRATTVLGVLFMLGALGLTIVSKSRGGGSVVSGVKAPATQQPAAPSLPTTPLPTTPAPAATDPGKTTTPPATTPAAPAKKGGGGL
jgi:preprotein translocase subunit SecG